MRSSISKYRDFSGICFKLFRKFFNFEHIYENATLTFEIEIHINTTLIFAMKIYRNSHPIFKVKIYKNVPLIY